MATLYLSDINSLDLSANYERAFSLLSVTRKKKMTQYKNSAAGKQVLLSELLLKRALADKGKDHVDLLYEYNEYGKPRLSNIDDFFFNISHSGDYVLLGVSDNEIGVDIERFRKFNPRIAQRFFTKEEYEDIMAPQDEEERRRLFFLYWVIKESFIKHSGKGLSQALDSFRIDIDDNDLITIYEEEKPSGLCFRHFNDLEGYSIASCTHEKDVELKMIDSDELIGGGVLL